MFTSTITLVVLIVLYKIYTRVKRDEERAKFQSSVIPSYADSNYEELTSDQLRRKEKSLEFCKTHGIKFNSKLPVIESESSTVVRSKEEIINRLVAIYYVSSFAINVNNEKLEIIQTKYNSKEYLTAGELDFINNPKLTKQMKLEFSLLFECCYVLMWCLNLIEDLGLPRDVTQEKFDKINLLSEKSLSELNRLNVRNKSQILDEADLIYRINWAFRNVLVTGVAPPDKFSSLIVHQRHYVLNWLINYEGLSWDNITCDT